MTRESSLKLDHQDLVPKLNRLKEAMIQQLDALVRDCDLTLGVPIESRVKTWESIEEKLERKGMTPKELEEVEDLLGLRVIFLFQRDLDPFHGKIKEIFNVMSEENTSDRLDDAQFGYHSRHYILTMPEGWNGVPSLNGLTGQKIELQVRTLAQHIWAAASHKLQYKHEQSVPAPLRRSIYRVSALLETVDLEFIRVLDNLKEYREAQDTQAADDDELNVTLVEMILDELLPPGNKDTGAEDYFSLLVDLQQFEIKSRKNLINLLQESMHEYNAA
ncbi:hypothetical protein DK842_21465 [Chromobacterium phragmitis]|uniref:GTP pyrophosphokinase n=1 Tax=Chromobacterium phragmitis TaxID=2202141 RepID=UPI000DED0C58|nr:RelA/SpoT domain-containing protein [Chromobacterium phragmitis]AXE32251.1 hypothetical protein DK842_21465 [Chromobacterium phragmitis]